MKHNLYDVQLKIADYLTAKGIVVMDNPSDSDDAFVVLDVSMDLDGMVSETGRSFGCNIKDDVVVSVNMPFILSVFVYGGNNENQRQNKKNIERMFLNTFSLLKKYEHRCADFNIRINGMSRVVWLRNPILENEELDATILNITLGGRAYYE